MSDPNVKTVEITVDEQGHSQYRGEYPVFLQGPFAAFWRELQNLRYAPAGGAKIVVTITSPAPAEQSAGTTEPVASVASES